VCWLAPASSPCLVSFSDWPMLWRRQHGFVLSRSDWRYRDWVIFLLSISYYCAFVWAYQLSVYFNNISRSLLACSCFLKYLLIIYWLLLLLYFIRSVFIYWQCTSIPDLNLLWWDVMIVIIVVLIMFFILGWCCWDYGLKHMVYVQFIWNIEEDFSRF